MLLTLCEFGIRQAHGIAGLLLRGDPFEDAVEMRVLDDEAWIDVRVVLGVEPVR